MDDYPESCVRGLRAKDDCTDSGDISASAFYPDPNTAPNRTDGNCETSVDWEDNGNVLPNVLNRFRYGAARLPRHHIDDVNGFASVRGGLGYERQPLEDNPHHGNILFPASIIRESKKRTVWATLLAANSTLHQREDDALRTSSPQ